MLIDAGALAPGARVEADVCIIGAGAAGLTLSHALAGSGLKVIVLERGGRRVDRRANRQNLVEVNGLRIGRPGRIRRFAVGGAGWLWSRVSLEMESLDFERRPWLDHSGWPFDRDELGRFYARARAKLRVPDGSGPSTSSSETEGIPSDRLALHPIAFSPVRFGGPETTDEASIYLGAAVRRLATGRDRRSVESAEAITPAGEGLSVKADVFVLAAGGIENPRLLLHSEIGNQHDLVGRFFADHPYLTIPISLPAGSSSPDDMVRNHLTRPSALVTMSGPVRREDGLLGSAAYFLPYRDPALGEQRSVQAWQDVNWARRHRDSPPDAARVYARAALGVPGLVRAVLDRRRSRNRLALRVALEPAPNPESRVTLSDRRDEFGIPLPRVDWRLGDAEPLALRRMLDELAAAADRGGWGPLGLPGGDGWPERMEGGAHHMGTTRMHENPEQGVVDSDCRVHGTTNLYVAGSSVFPTFGYANPMLTIVALAIRLGYHLETAPG